MSLRVFEGYLWKPLPLKNIQQHQFVIETVYKEMAWSTMQKLYANITCLSIYTCLLDTFYPFLQLVNTHVL